MSAMGNRRTCCFEEKFEVIDKSSQFYNSDDIGAHFIT